MIASGTNLITVTDLGQISGGQSTSNYGGVAYMTGTNNYLNILNGGIVS